jgi:hypothetical protein
MVIPVPKSSPIRANKLSTQFNAPYTPFKCRILDFISLPLKFAGNLAFWGAVYGSVPHLAGKRCIFEFDQPLLQDISFLNVM